MSYKNILLHISDHLAYVTINRPDKLNALNFETLHELNLVFDSIYENKDVKAVILTGSGEKSFVAGADITEIAKLDRHSAEKVAQNGQNLLFKIENCPKPVIAMVNGYALGGGCELAMACHIRIVSEKAIFAQPEINLGIIPGYGGTQRLTQLIGKGRALELIFTGENINAQRAFEIGLVNQVHSAELLKTKTEEFAQKIISKPRIGLSTIIQSVNSVFDESKNGYEVEASSFGECCSSGDFVEGTSAFLEKRKPNFK